MALLSVESRLKEAIESERYDAALSLLTEYSACVAGVYESGDGGAATELKVKELMSWAYRAILTARADAAGEFQLISDSRAYTAPDSDRKTWQVML